MIGGQIQLSVCRNTLPQDSPTPKPLNNKFNFFSVISVLNFVAIVRGIDAELELPNS
jgi:hypothetical protein